MTSRKLLQQAVGLALIVLLLAGCGGAPADLIATPITVSVPTSIPSLFPIFQRGSTVQFQQ